MKALYHENPALFTFHSKVIRQGRDDAGLFLICEQTIFYPQGGGQPFDQGTILIEDQTIPIIGVKMRDGEIRHYVELTLEEFVGKQALLNVEPKRRHLHSRLHTAGHLISHAVETVYPGCRAIKGHHFPGECYVDFSMKNSTEMDLSLVQKEIDKLISEKMEIVSDYVNGADLSKVCPNLSYSVPEQDKIRLVRIGKFDYQPCCGTHVSSLEELKGLQVIKQKQKGNQLKISYKIE